MYQFKAAISFWRHQRHLRNKKLTEESISYFFRADDYAVVKETLGMKYGAKKMQRRATETENHMVP